MNELIGTVAEGTYYYPEPLIYQQQVADDFLIPPGLRKVLLGVWVLIVILGLSCIYFLKQKYLGALLIAMPTFIGMVLEPTFALSMMMMSITTGAGIGFAQIFSLDRGVGIALTVAFFINYMIARRPLHIKNNVIWILGIYSLYNAADAFLVPYTSLEIVRAFTQLQLFLLLLIVYWIMMSRKWYGLMWILRAYVIAMVGVVALAFLTGAAMRSEEIAGHQERYSATLGAAVNSNFLASMTGVAVLSAIYLLVKDKSFRWRVIYFVSMLVLAIMMFKMGSRGALLALGVTFALPVLFLRQVVKHMKVILIVILGFGLILGAGYFAFKRGLIGEKVQQRLTSVEHAKTSFNTRWTYAMAAMKMGMSRPFGTGYYAWPERTGLDHFPHNDFFFILGIYGVVSAMLYVVFIIFMIITIMRMPLCLEKIYLRAVFTFIFVVSMIVTAIMRKYYWIYMGIILAGADILKEQSQYYYYAVSNYYNNGDSQQYDEVANETKQG